MLLTPCQWRRSNLFHIFWLLIIITIQCLLGQHINKSFDIVLVVNGWMIQQQTYHLRRPLTSIRTTTQQQRYAKQQSMNLYHNVPTDTVYGENIYIVTGSNGYIGRAVVHELLDHFASNNIYDDPNHKVSTSNAFTTNNTATIICLVRSHHVTNEQSYWIEHLRQRQQQQCNKYCSIHVFPYDMLDGGETFRFALNFALQQQHDLSESYDTSVNPIRTISSSSLCIFHIASVFGPTTEYEQTAYNNVRGSVDLINILGETITKTTITTSNNNDTTTTTPITMKRMIQLPCKLIVTSSMAAVRGTGQLPINQQYYTSDDWNTVSIIHNENDKNNTSVKNWGTYYQWSKMESERQAWDLCRNKWKDCIAMVALCPSFVFGPSTSMETSSSSYSITLVDQWIQGISPVQSRLFVDVRDVAKAHVMAAIQPKAIGKRIILSTEARISSQDIAKWLQDEIHQNTVIHGNITYDPNKIHYDDQFQGGSIPIGCKEVEATEILHEILGITLRPVKDTIVDMAKILLSRNIER